MSDTTEATILDRRAVVERLLAVIDAHPDNVNPVGPAGICEYTSVADPSRHCLVGQMAVEQGWPLPEGNDDADDVAREMWPVDDDAGRALSQAQGLADNRTGSKANPRTWRSIRAGVAALAEVSG